MAQVGHYLTYENSRFDLGSDLVNRFDVLLGVKLGLLFFGLLLSAYDSSVSTEFVLMSKASTANVRIINSFSLRMLSVRI